jgi:hypothetical protein
MKELIKKVKEAAEIFWKKGHDAAGRAASCTLYFPNLIMMLLVEQLHALCISLT